MAESSEKCCVIHYGHLEFVNKNVTPLTHETYDRLLKSRDARIKLGGAHNHEKQIRGIPEQLVLGEHFVHRSCYQNFTKAISVEANKNDKAKKIGTKASPLKRKRRETVCTGHLFPKLCMKCKSAKLIKVKGKKQPIRIVQTFSACKTLKQAATLRNDEEMLSEISGVDLIAKEFQMHPKCYKDYTLICSKQSTSTTTDDVTEIMEETDADETQRRGDFDSVCSFVITYAINGCQPISLKALTEMYGFNKEDLRDRSKLKQRLEATFGDKIMF